MSHDNSDTSFEELRIGHEFTVFFEKKIFIFDEVSIPPFGAVTSPQKFLTENMVTQAKILENFSRGASGATQPHPDSLTNNLDKPQTPQFQRPSFGLKLPKTNFLVY